MSSTNEEQEGLKQKEVCEASAEDVVQGALGEAGLWQAPTLVLMGCVVMVVVWSDLAVILLAPPPASFTCTDGNTSCTTWTGDTCSHWSYDRSVFEQTIITEWDLVCEQRHLVTAVQTTFRFGVMIGSISFSILADRIGRKIPLLIAGMLQGLAGTAAGFSPWYWSFLGLRLIQALGAGGSMAIAPVIFMEIIGPKSRSKFGTLSHLSVFLSTSLATLVAYLTRHWRWFQVATTLPCLLSIAFYWIIPESPRWLVAVGKTKQALRVIQKAARRNHNPVPEYLPRTVKSAQENAHKPTLFDLLRTPRMRRNSLVMWMNFLASGFSYYGLQQYIIHLGGNIFLNVAISGMCGIPGVFLAMYIMSNIGRRMSQIIGQLTCSVACLLMLVISGGEWTRVGLAIVGVVGTGISFPTVYLYASELAPTILRNTAMGTGAVSARIGAMIAPFIIGLNSTADYLPPMFVGGLSLLAAVLCIFLPETRNAPLPATLEDAENFKGKPTGRILDTSNVGKSKKVAIVKTKDPKSKKEEANAHKLSIHNEIIEGEYRKLDCNEKIDFEKDLAKNP